MLISNSFRNKKKWLLIIADLQIFNSNMWRNKISYTRLKRLTPDLANFGGQ